jgi:hypothetical protein
MGYCSDLGLMSNPHAQLAGTHAGIAALLGACLCVARSIGTKTQHGPVALCSTLGTACVDMGGGVSHAEVVP